MQDFETKMKSYLRFAGRVTAAHVVTYIGVGALAYAFLTGEFFDGSNVRPTESNLLQPF